MEPSLYAAPLGIEDDAGDLNETTEFEIEPEDGMAVVEIEIDMPIFDENLAESMDSRDLTRLAGDLCEEVDNDRESRKEWEKAYIDGLQLLGLQYEERTEPWAGACGVVHPMITEAVVKFQSEVITETFPAQGPVRTKIIGEETPEKKESAQRVEEDMNHQLTDEMVEFRPEHERMLWSLPAAGSAFKKVYYDPSLGRQTSIFVPAEDIILPYGVSDVRASHRVTHQMRKTKNEILKLQQAGFYMDVELGDPTKDSDKIKEAKDKETGFSDVNDDRYVLYEIHADLDLPGYEDADEAGVETGIGLPYVITVIKGTSTVLAVRRNWKETDELKAKRQHFVHYQYIPGFGAYGFGLFHLIGGFAKSATSIMRQLVDAGTLSNLPGGLKTRGLRIKGDNDPIAPGEFRDVDVGSGTIKDNILPLPYKEPSQVLYTLLGNIVEEGRRFAATADLKVSDMSSQSPVGTTLALLERQLKVMTAVQARVHFALKQELRLIAKIIEDYTDDDYTYKPDTGGPSAKKSDYSNVNIIPVSDPNAATMSPRVVQYPAVIQMAQMAPQIYDLPELHRGMLDVLGIKNAAKLIPLVDDMKPIDPISENMALITGKPLKAFIAQDHESHIIVHNSFFQDPITQQTLGQNPQAQQMMASMQAHIAEHFGFVYRKKIEERLGAPLPIPDAELTPDIEASLSRLVAQAAQQLLQINKGQQAQQAAQAAQQDPIVQMQQKELQIKEQETQIKQQKVRGELQIKQGELQLKQQEVAAKTQATQPDPMAAQQAQQQSTQQAAQAQQSMQQAAQQHEQQLAAQQQQAAIQRALQEQSVQHQQALSHQHRTHKQQMHDQSMAMKRQAHQHQLAINAFKAKNASATTVPVKEKNGK